MMTPHRCPNKPCLRFIIRREQVCSVWQKDVARNRDLNHPSIDSKRFKIEVFVAESNSESEDEWSDHNLNTP